MRKLNRAYFYLLYRSFIVLGIVGFMLHSVSGSIIADGNQHNARSRENLPSWLTIPGLELKIAVRTTTAIFEPNEDDAGFHREWVIPLGMAGHHADTPSFGETGNVIIAGHSVWYDVEEVFYRISGLQRGDLLIGQNSDGSQSVYRVTKQWETDYHDADWLSTVTTEPTLTLYTCKHDLTGLVVVQATIIDSNSD